MNRIIEAQVRQVVASAEQQNRLDNVLAGVCAYAQEHPRTCTLEPIALLPICDGADCWAEWQETHAYDQDALLSCREAYLTRAQEQVTRWQWWRLALQMAAMAVCGGVLGFLLFGG